MNRGILGLALCLSVTGCGPTKYQDITGQQRGMPELKMDSAECEILVDTTPTPMGACVGACVAMNVLADNIRQQNSFNHCLLAHGWEQVE